MKHITATLIITTYNWPQALELVLLSVQSQSVMPCEIIIADDGSTEETALLIQRLAPTFSVPLIHSWQEDSGFRLSRSRNLAIAKASGDYLVMIDGDMVLHPHFIRDHLKAAKPSQWIQGRRVILTESLTQQRLSSKNIRFSLFSSQVKNKANAICCPILSPLISKQFSKKDHRSVRGCNMSFWRQDVIAVNGFNEDFVGWGREDSEFVVRLFNHGIARYDLRFGGVAYHLYHRENTKACLAENDKILAEAIDNKASRCKNGLDNHM